MSVRGMYSSGGTASVDTLTTTMIVNLTTAQAAALSSSQAAGLAVATVTGLTAEQIASTKIGMAKVGSPTNASLHFLLQHFWSTGMIDGGAITDNADGTFDIAACDFMVRQGTAEDDPLVVYRIAAATAINTTANDVNWIYLDYNSGSPQYAVTTSFAAFNGLDKVVCYGIGRTGSHNHILDLRAVNVDAQRKLRRRDSEWDGFAYQGFWRSYLYPSALTASGLNILVGAGSYWYFNKNVTHAAFDTTVAGTAEANVFTLWYNRTGTWTSVADQKSINATQYDNAGTLSTMNNNKWRKDWVFVIPDSSHSHLVVILGNAEYTTQAEAEAGPRPSSLPPQFAEMAVLVGWLTIQKSAASVAISQAGVAAISGGSVTDHGALAGLSDDDHPQYVSLTGTQTISGEKVFAGQVAVEEIIEKFTTSATAATGTVNFDILTHGQILAYTTNASANWILNVRGDGSNTLNALLAANECITICFDVQQGSTAYYPTALKIDGNATTENGYTITTKWQGGSAPSAGNASSWDVYVYNIQKTADKTFVVRASQIKFA